MRDWRPLRWIYHLRVHQPAGPSGVYAPASLEREGFIHGSFAPKVRESARLYFPPSAELEVLQLDPRRLRCRVDYARTPRGVMPHVCGSFAMYAVRSITLLADFDEAVDVVRGGRIVARPKR